MTLPSSMTWMQSAVSSTKLKLCSIKTTVTPADASMRSALRRSATSPTLSPEAGSSRRITLGFAALARAAPTTQRFPTNRGQPQERESGHPQRPVFLPDPAESRQAQRAADDPHGRDRVASRSHYL